MEFTNSDIIAGFALIISLGSLWYTRKKALFESSVIVAEHCRNLKEIAIEQINNCDEYFIQIDELIRNMDGCKDCEHTKQFKLYKQRIGIIKNKIEKASKDISNTKMDANPIELTCRIVDGKDIAQDLKLLIEDLSSLHGICEECKSEKEIG